MNIRNENLSSNLKAIFIIKALRLQSDWTLYEVF